MYFNTLLIKFHPSIEDLWTKCLIFGIGFFNLATTSAKTPSMRPSRQRSALAV
ncbi:hypothetical protein [Moraxella lacunata]|uniref:hypothetical protein n=1 Tax=Moraxella lacunata TaxID=477 RepID=UPI003EE1C465